MSERGNEMVQRIPVPLGGPGNPKPSVQVSTMVFVDASIVCGNGWLQRGLKYGFRSWPVHTFSTSPTYFSLNMYGFDEHFFENSAKFTSGSYRVELDYISAVEFI